MIQIILTIVPTILLLAIIWYIVKFFFKKTGLLQNKKYYKIISVLLTTLAIYLLIVKIVFSMLIDIPKEKFDEFKWKSNVSERYKMIDDLMESKYIINKDSEKIIEVFGEPKEKIIEEENNIWTYELIERSWADFKITTLKIYFKDGVAYKTYTF